MNEITPIVSHNFCIEFDLVTKYGKIDYKKKSFLGSDMSNKLKFVDQFNGNLTAMGGCKYGSRRDIGLVAPSNLTSGYETTL